MASPADETSGSRTSVETLFITREGVMKNETMLLNNIMRSVKECVEEEVNMAAPIDKVTVDDLKLVSSSEMAVRRVRNNL